MLHPRDLIKDNYGRLAIVLWGDPAPQPGWPEIQNDSRMRALGPCRWSAIAPLIGGGACVPEPLAEFIRAATLEDTLGVARAHRTSYFKLLRSFPQLADAMPGPDI